MRKMSMAIGPRHLLPPPVRIDLLKNNVVFLSVERVQPADDMIVRSVFCTTAQHSPTHRAPGNSLIRQVATPTTIAQAWAFQNLPALVPPGRELSPPILPSFADRHADEDRRVVHYPATWVCPLPPTPRKHCYARYRFGSDAGGVFSRVRGRSN